MVWVYFKEIRVEHLVMSHFMGIYNMMTSKKMQSPSIHCLKKSRVTNSSTDRAHSQ